MTDKNAPSEAADTGVERTGDRQATVDESSPSVPASVLAQPVDGTETTRLGDLCEEGERPLWLLTGTMLDRVTTGDSDGDEDGDGGDGGGEDRKRKRKRKRKMAAPGCAVVTLVTDQAVSVVVGYREGHDVRRYPLETLERASLEQAAGETRVQIQCTDERVDVYPSDTPVETVREAVAYLDGQPRSADSAARKHDESTDAVSALERLAALYDRGLLTDEEFTTAKRDVLDES